ncbi:MAG: hypothetical protein ACOYIR_07930 [Christensenellales bacterium]|jgi:hypothetical protein
MATYIIALRPVFGRASGLVRVGPDGARFSLRGVSFGRAHLILQNGRTRSANIRPTPGGGTAFIPLRGREFPLGAAVTSRGIVVLIGTTGTRASDILEKAKQLAADPDQRRAEEAAAPMGEEAAAQPAAPPSAGEEASPVPPGVEPVKPEALAALAAKEEPFIMPQPPMAKVEPQQVAEQQSAEQQQTSGPQQTAEQQEIIQTWQRTLHASEGEAKVPEAAINRRVAPEEPAPKQQEISPPETAEPSSPPSGTKEDCAAYTETERGGMIASFMLEDAEQSAPPPKPPAWRTNEPPEMAAAKADTPSEEASYDFMEARSPHAFYQPVFDDDAREQPVWSSGAASSEQKRERPMVGRRLGVFSNAFPGDWPRVNWQVFSHPGGTHLLYTRVNDRELYAIPARPSATPPAGIPAHARYCVSRTGQGYWVF